MSIPGIIAAAAFAVAALILFWAYDRWYIPWLTRQRLWKAFSDFQYGKTRKAPKPQKPDGIITFDSNGFRIAQQIRGEERTVLMKWDEVQSVTVFKRDIFVVDCICLLAVRSSGSAIELDEEMGGWQELIEAMPIYLDGCTKWESWFMAIVSPAFAPSRHDSM